MGRTFTPRKGIAVIGIGAVTLLAAACGSSSGSKAASTPTSAPPGSQAQTQSSAGTSSSENDHGVTVRIEGDNGTGIADLAIADGSMQKALAPLGAKAETVGNFTALAPAVSALQAGALDIANGSITATFGSMSGGADIEIFGWGKDAPEDEAILVKKNSSITSVAQLAGKTVAVNQGGTGEYLLDQALSYNHVPLSSVKKAYLLAPAGNTAFQSGNVDAWSTFATFIPLALQHDNARVLVYGGQVGTQNDTDWVVSSSFAAAHPHLLKVLFGVLRAEEAKVIANPTAYNAAVAKADKFGAPELKVLDDALEPLEPVQAAQVATFQQIANFFQQSGGFKKPVTVSGKTIDVTTLP